jgi:hypothetical protein
MAPTYPKHGSIDRIGVKPVNTLSTTRTTAALAVLLAAGTAYPQDSPAPDLRDREARIVERIDRAQADGGENAAELIEPLTDLGLLLEQQGDLTFAVEAYQRARDVTRVNYGFSTLDEAQLLGHLIRTEETRGNAPAAWKLEQEMLDLAAQNPEDVRSARIFADVAENRMRVLELYRAGKAPPQIQLGCYYAKIPSLYTLIVGAAELRTPPPLATCTSGAKSVVVLALLMEARLYEAAAVNVLMENGGYASDDLGGFVVEVLRKTETLRVLVPQYQDRFITRFLDGLTAYEPTDALSLHRHAEVLLHSADWSLLRANDAHRYTALDSVLAQYEQAFNELEQSGAGPAALEAAFSPPIPLVLPGLDENPLASHDSSGAGHIDVEFEITRLGRAADVRIVAATDDVPRSTQKDFLRLLETSTFRPRVVDGRVADSTPVSLRYYPPRD